MRTLTKRVFLNAWQCPTLGWFERHGGGSGELSASAQFLMEQGQEIGYRVRNLFGSGTLIESQPLVEALKATEIQLADSSVPALFEAAFRHGDCIARADILRRVGEGWHLVEVKSGLDVRPDYEADLAYTLMVLRGAGVSVECAELALVSREYRHGRPDSELFVFEDRTSQVTQLASRFEQLRPRIEVATAASEAPEASLRKICRDCPEFSENCLGRGIEHSVLELPRLKQARLTELTELGVESINQVPEDFKLTPGQARVRKCVQSGRRHIGSGLSRTLAKINWPALYLDFESVTTALPLFPGIAPYEQVPIQYSIHQCSRIGEAPDHREYLADPQRDCRRELAERLLEDLAGTGSILVYSSFEKTMMRALARWFPDLEGDLMDCSERLFDLLAVVRKEIYDPAFYGSYSIKVVLPVLVADLSYDDLEISDGGSAAATFARMALGEYTPDEEEALRQALLLYCGRDTEAMVRLHQSLLELARA